MSNFHVPDYLILPFGRAVKSDLQKIALSAVSADGLYFATDVPVIFIRKSDHRPICLGDFEKYFGDLPAELSEANDHAYLSYICKTLKSHNPNMTPSEEQFLDLYFLILNVLAFFTLPRADRSPRPEWLTDAIKNKGMTGQLIDTDWYYNSPKDLWRALLPIPELQLYVQDPLSGTKTFQPDNNFRVDYGFWDGQNLIAVEIDGAEPAGYARDIRRDRLLRRAGVDVIHILNLELARYKARALTDLLSRRFFGSGWDYEGSKPEVNPF
jgi:hypothetical protein